jgi:secondary thiamine-phosphate synthase enzyme
MKSFNRTIEFQTKGLFDFIDITDEIKNFVKENQIKNGLVNVQILHTSAGLIVNENEPLLIEDFKNNLEKTAPRTLNHQHDDLSKRTANLCPEECINGHSHCKAIHLLVSATLNLIEGEMQLGQWQRVFLVELDRTRERRVQIQIIGE